jgi:hypothetical protein
MIDDPWREFSAAEVAQSVDAMPLLVFTPLQWSAPRPIPLHHRAIKAQINPGLYPSPDERRGSGQTGVEICRASEVSAPDPEPLFMLAAFVEIANKRDLGMP